MRAFAKSQAARLQSVFASREAGAMLISVLLAVAFGANIVSHGLAA